MGEARTIAWTLRGGVPARTAFMRVGDENGEGTPLVLIHGVGMRHDVWQPQLAALSRDRIVVAYDMLGHGGSTLPPPDARLSDYSDQFAALLDALGLDAVHVAGHSMGALVALESALAHPSRVRSVTALNAVYRRSPAQRAAVEQRAAALDAGGPAASSTMTLARWFGDPIPAELRETADRVQALLEGVDPVGYARTYRLFATSDDAHSGRLAHLAMPALFMTGEGDPNSTPAMSRAMAEEAPRGRCEVLAGERHMMNLTAAGAVNDRLARFLVAVESVGGATTDSEGESRHGSLRIV